MSDLLKTLTNGPGSSGIEAGLVTDIAIIAKYFPGEMAEKQK